MIDSIANHRDGCDRDATGGSESKQRCSLHLDRENAFTGPLFKLRLRLPIRSVSRPDPATANRPSGRSQFARQMGHYRGCRAGDLITSRQVMKRGAFIANRAGHRDKARKRQFA